MYDTENDIAQPLRARMSALLNSRLADVIDLQMDLKQAHWNVKGPNFISLHELFGKVAETLGLYSDTLAERIVQLGGIAEGTVRVVGMRSRLIEYPLTIGEGLAHVHAVAAAISKFGSEIRSSIAKAAEMKDDDTADIFTEISRGVDKWLWLVEAHAQADN